MNQFVTAVSETAVFVAKRSLGRWICEPDWLFASPEQVSTNRKCCFIRPLHQIIKWLRIGKERCLTSLRNRKKKKKNAYNDGGESQETSSSTISLTDYQITLQRTNLFKVPMKVKHRPHQISPAPVERKNYWKAIFSKNLAERLWITFDKGSVNTYHLLFWIVYLWPSRIWKWPHFFIAKGPLAPWFQSLGRTLVAYVLKKFHMDRNARKPVFRGLLTNQAQISLRICAVWSAPFFHFLESIII